MSSLWEMPLKKLFISASLALLLCQPTCRAALPSQISEKTIPARFAPQVLYETYGAGVELSAGLAKGTAEETALSLVIQKLGISNDQVTYRAGFSLDNVDYSYLNQVHNGISFINSVANMAVKDDKIVAFGSSFVKADKIAPSQPSVNEKDAIEAAEAALRCLYDGYPTSIRYLANADESVSLVYAITVKNDDSGEWYEAHVDAHSGKVISAVDFVAHNTYTAVPINKYSILDGQSVLVNPEDMSASSLGWHNDGSPKFVTNSTKGNNGQATINNRFTYETSKGTYAYQYDTRKEPFDLTNANASLVNTFYAMNKVHDVMYKYGFTERAFNFQTNNFKNGGMGNDAVVIKILVDTKGPFNNAFFSTLQDGRPGECTFLMYNSNTTKSFLSSAMDNTIIVHELGHGVSNRLVGGGTAVCLSSDVYRKGLGEGWSDCLADWMTQTSKMTKDFKFLAYLLPNNPKGARRYPYSTDMKVNPLLFSNVSDIPEEHYIGEVWANTLHNVYAALVTEHDFSNDAMTNPNAPGGNAVFMRLFIRALMLTPCDPDFLKARDAFIQADQVLNIGKNKCLLWKAFASRGLGFDATIMGKMYKNGFKLPADCPKK